MVVSFLRLVVCIAVGLALVGAQSSAKRVAANNIAPDKDPHCRFHHDLCVSPKQVYLDPSAWAIVAVTVQSGQKLVSSKETDNCQGLATFHYDEFEGNFAIWDVIAAHSAPAGTCAASFTGMSISEPLGPVILNPVGPAILRVYVH